MKQCSNICFGVALLAAAASAFGAGDAVRGKSLYETRCTACHSIEYNGVGPAHKEVFGRKAGSVRDYEYSLALKSADILWTEKTLGQWLANPEKLSPGQKMGYSVPNAKDRADLIAYLRKESGK